MKDTYNNPFSGSNAVMLDDTSILNYWCDPFNYRLFTDITEKDIYSSPMNLVFMGGRNTGKTMFLRYWSFQVQFQLANQKKITSSSNLLNHFLELGGIGIYLRIDGPSLRSFTGYGISDEKWNAIFIQYFELLIARKYLEVIEVLINKGEINENLFISKSLPIIVKLFRLNEIKSLGEVVVHVEKLISEIDEYRGSVPFYNTEFKPQNGFGSRTLSFGIPKILESTIPEFNKKIKFVILLDEYENFSEIQQRIINTLLRFTDSEIMFRIGMRLKGFRTFKMISQDDFIKEGREYQKIVLEELLLKAKGYNEFLKEVAKKRLNNVNIFREFGRTDITEFLGLSEDLEAEAIELVAKNPNKHFDYFKEHLAKANLELLRYPKNPLLELLNILWFIRGKSEIEINKAMNGYLKRNYKQDLAEKYRLDYVDKYKLSLTFLLCSIHRKNKMYYSFNTFSFLSSGIVGNFIELCRRAFKYAEFEENERLLQEFKITKEQQNKAAIDCSESELEQLVRIENDGGYIYRLILNLGNIFRDFHKDEKIKYPETNQFSIDINSLEEHKFKQAFESSIKWSAIQRKPKLQQPAPGKHLKDIYTLNRIFSPSFQISHRTRGGFSIELSSKSLQDLMLSEKISSRDFMPKEKRKIKKQNLDLFEDE